MRNKSVVWFTWRPEWPALWPLVMFLGSFGLLRAGARLLGRESLWVWLLITATLAILLAGWHMLRSGRPVTRALGITEESWQQAIGVGAVLGLLLGGAQAYRHITAGEMLTIPTLDRNLFTLALTIALIVAGDEVLFRGWFAAALEPAFGFVPTLLASSLAYASLPLALGAVGNAAQATPYLPAGYMPPTSSGALLLFVVAVFLFGIFRLTGSLWASGTANFIARFALVFVWPLTNMDTELSALTLAIVLALWIVVVLGIRRWMGRSSMPHSQP
jgi:membrane protease YdiL (CAAX protease family)